MNFIDLLERNPCKRGDSETNLEKDGDTYYSQMAERLCDLLPDDYNIDDVAAYVFFSEQSVGADKELVLKDFKEKQKEKIKLLGGIKSKTTKIILKKTLWLSSLGALFVTLIVPSIFEFQKIGSIKSVKDWLVIGTAIAIGACLTVFRQKVFGFNQNED